MANYVKFKQGLKKDFNTTNQPLTNGMIYFVIDENNHGSIYYDTVVDGAQATKKGTVHRVKFSGLPIKITGSVTGTGVISKDGESIEINTSTNHSHGLVHQDFTVMLSNDDTNLKWTRLGNQNGGGFWLKSIRGQLKAPAWFLPDYSAGIAFGGADTKGIISVKYSQPGVRFAGGNGDAPVWYFTITGANDKTYDLSKIGGHSSDSAKLDHNVTFKITSTADAKKGADGTATNLSGATVDIYLPTKISGFDLLQASRFQGNADSATYATSAGYAKGLFLNPETRQEDMNFNLADAKYIKRVTYSMATSTTKKNKPPIGDANILSFGWDNSGYGSQLAIQNGGAGHLAVRGSSSNNGASSWGDWSTVLDSSNYTSYINNYYWANVKVSTSSSTETKPTFNTAYTSNWWRSTGNTGWWNETHSGGIAMEDNTYVKVAGNKSFFIPNGSLKIGGNGNILFATGSNDATFKIYGQNIKDYGTETIAIQTCFDNQDPQTSGYTTQYANRCNLLLQPRGGQVYIGVNLGTVGDTGYKLLVGGNQWINGNLVFNGAREIKFAGSKATFSMIRFIDNTTDTYGNGISIGGGGSTVIGAGESAMSFVTNGGDKRLFLLSDGSINVEAGGDTIANRKGFQVTGDGHVIPIKAENSNPNAQDLGSAADYWRNLYINNIILQGQTGNRLVWTNGSKILQAGYHYADTDRIAINTAGRQGYNFYVNGSSYFSGNTYIHRNSIIKNASDGTGDVVLNVLGYKASGYPLYADPEFASGANGVAVYNNASNGVVVHARVADATCGNSSGQILRITHTGSGSPGFGGFVQNITSRANAIFIQIFRAKIPAGRNLATASNSMGNNYKDEWLTPTAGTGKWEWYARRVICGTSGTFSTGGHVYIKDGAAPTASAPLVWYLSYCNVIDVTKGNYDGLRTRYSDYATYANDGSTVPINKRFVAKIVRKTVTGTEFTFKGLDGLGNDLADTNITIPNAGKDNAGLITNAAQTIYGEKTLTSNLRFANVSTGIRGIVGTIADNDCWRVVGRADKTDEGYLEIATGDGSNEPIYMRQYSGTFGTVTRTFTVLDGSGRSRAPELFEAKKIHVNSKLNQNAAIADISYQFQVTGTSNFTDTVNISGVTNHHNNIQIDANYSIARPGRSSNWFGSHNTAMIRMTTINGWAPLLAQRATNGYWVLGHYNNGSDFNDQWVFGYLANSNLEGTSGAKNDLSTKYRMRNVGGEKNILFSTYNVQIGGSVNPVYIKSNGEAVACSYSLSATIEAGTANRMAYYKTANQIGSSGHYVTSSQVGINASSSKDYTFYVGGTSLLDNAVTINGNLHIIPDTDVGLNAAGSLVIGNKSGQNMGLDGNEIMARNNSKASALYLNNEGGIVQVGQDGITIQAKASSTNLQSGGLRISSENAGNSGNVALELYRGNNGSWQIANEGAILYFRTNWVSEKKTTYAKNALIIDHTTGAASLPFLAIGQEARNTTYGLYVVSSQSWIKNTLWAGNILPDKNNNVDNNLGSSQWRWGSLHIYRNFNIYGNESTTDESHIKFNASDNTQRAIITFNGNVNNGAQSDTHLKIATSYGAIKIKPANGYLDLGSGNDLHIQANTKSFNQDIIAAYDAVTGWGIDLVIGSGATTIVGAGESAAAMYSAGIKNNENLYLSADGNVFLYTNCDTIANRRYACFDTGRNFYPDADNNGSIGTFNNRWNTGWFNTLNLAGATSGTIANSTPRIIFQEKNGANKIQAVGIVYTDVDTYRSTKGLKIMDVDGSDGGNVWLEVQGDIWTGGNIRINNNKTLIQNQSDTSNYTEAVKWYKGGKSQNTYDPQIGQHNTGNNGTGSICILPYATATAPWSGSVGLFIAKSKMLLDNYRVPTTGNSGGTVGSASVPVYSDNGVLKTITSYSGNAATATKLQTTRNIILNGNLQGSASFNGTGDATITALNYQSSVSGGNTYNYPWHRIATTVVGTGQYNDRSALLRIRHTFNGGGEGLVKVSVRTNSTGSGCDISAIWLYRYNIAANNIGIGLWGVTGDNVYLDVYYKYVGGWPRAIVESISNGRIFTLISSNEANDTTTTDKKASSEVYTSIENGATLIRGKAYTKIVYGSDGNDNGRYVLKTGDTMSGHLNNNSEFITTSQNGFRISAASSTNTKSMLLRNDGSDFYILCCNSATAGNNWYTPTGRAHPLRINLTTGYSYFSKVYGAVWNDYAEYRSTSKVKPGQCVIETGLGDLIQSTKRLQPGANIVSDTFGFAIGETEQTKTPIAVSGRVLAYPYEDRNSYQAGDPVCSGPNGTISKMTREEVREYPDRIIGTVSEIPDYEIWGTGNVKVNNRIWIKVK